MIEYGLLSPRLKKPHPLSLKQIRLHRIRNQKDEIEDEKEKKKDDKVMFKLFLAACQVCLIVFN